MLDFIIVFGVMFLLMRGISWLLTSSPRMSGLTSMGIERCPPHKWDYKKFKNIDNTEYERMVCTKCLHFPGQE